MKNKSPVTSIFDATFFRNFIFLQFFNIVFFLSLLKFSSPVIKRFVYTWLIDDGQDLQDALQRLQIEVVEYKHRLDQVNDTNAGLTLNMVNNDKSDTNLFTFSNIFIGCSLLVLIYLGISHSLDLAQVSDLMGGHAKNICQMITKANNLNIEKNSDLTKSVLGALNTQNETQGAISEQTLRITKRIMQMILNMCSSRKKSESGQGLDSSSGRDHTWSQEDT